MGPVVSGGEIRTGWRTENARGDNDVCASDRSDSYRSETSGLRSGSQHLQGANQAM